MSYETDTRNPGPTYYDPQKVKSNAPKMSFPKSLKEVFKKYKETNPGPGQYNIKQIQTNRFNAVSFDK